MTDLIAALYEGPLEAPPFTGFLSALRDELAAAAATLLIDRPDRDRPGLFLNIGGTREGAARYRDLFAADPFTDLSLNSLVTMREHLGEEGLARAAELRKFQLETGTSETLGVDFLEPGGARVRLRISRAEAAGDFGPAEKAKLAPLLPHLTRAVGLFMRQLAIEAERNLYDEVLSRLSLGVMLADRVGRVLHASEIARAMLPDAETAAHQSALSQLDVGASDARALAALVTANADSAFAGRPPPARALRLTRRDGVGQLGVSVRPAPSPARLDAPLKGAAVVIIADMDRQVAPRARALVELFGLTPTESELSVLIAQGFDLNQASARLGVARNTVRAHLRAVFAKTGVSRQSELVRLLLRSVDELT